MIVQPGLTDGDDSRMSRQRLHQIQMPLFHVSRIVRKVPPDRILIETDCPYLAPVPHRGKRNEPAFVADTARFIAKTREIELEQLVSETYRNYTRLFSLEDN